MEKEKDKNIKLEMETGFIYGLIRTIINTMLPDALCNYSFGYLNGLQHGIGNCLHGFNYYPPILPP